MNGLSLTDERRKNRAFTLVEFVVAMAVFVFGAYAVYNQFIRTRPISQQSLQKATARLLAQEKLEELRACSVDSLKAFSPSERYEPIASHPRYRFKAELSVRDDGSIDITANIGWDPVFESDGQEFEAGKYLALKGLRSP